MPHNKPVRELASLMSDQLLCVYEGWSIQRLARFFIDHNISGAPVMASDHQLVGVVSASDVFRFDNAPDDIKGTALLNCYRDNLGFNLPDYGDLQNWTNKAKHSCTVHQIMSKEVISVDINSPQKDAATLLTERNIHRVFVTDDEKIVGVISSLDLLRNWSQ